MWKILVAAEETRRIYIYKNKSALLVYKELEKPSSNSMKRGSERLKGDTGK